MSWANQRVYAAVQTLPESALDWFIINPEWTAKRILRHILGGSDWYCSLLADSDMSDLPRPVSMADVREIAVLLQKRDAVLLECSDLEDAPLRIDSEILRGVFLRSTILSQAVHHATEHRAQLIDALDYKGYKSIILDTCDVWSFESFEKSERYAHFHAPHIPAADQMSSNEW